MDRAQRQPVRDLLDAASGELRDVGRLDELAALERANGATLAVRREDFAPEPLLLEPDHDFAKRLVARRRG